MQAGPFSTFHDHLSITKFCGSILNLISCELWGAQASASSPGKPPEEMRFLEMNSVTGTQPGTSSFSFLICFKFMFLLLYQHLQIKTWRGNSLGVNSFQLLLGIQLQKAATGLKANAVKIFTEFKIMKLEETALKEHGWKHERADFKGVLLNLLNCVQNCSFSTDASETAGIYWPFRKKDSYTETEGALSSFIVINTWRISKGVKQRMFIIWLSND